MTFNYKGKVCWANGLPVQGIEIRLYEPGKGREPLGKELTLQPGQSKRGGSFGIEAHDTKLIDNNLLLALEGYSSIFTRVGHIGQSLGSDPRPIFQFTYEINDQKIQYQAKFRKLHRLYHLPHNPPVDFLPSKHGFQFDNNFKLFFAHVTLPAWLGRKSIPEAYGLCGGMSSAAYDYRLADLDNSNSLNIRNFANVPNRGSRLHRYLIGRSLDTFGQFGEKIDKVGDWTRLPLQGAAGTQKLSLDEFPEIKKRLKEKQCLVLTLIYEHAVNRGELIKKIWNNHQVLAHKLIEIDQNNFKICIYDSNFHDRDDIVIKLKREQVGISSGKAVFGLSARQIVPGKGNKVVRGLFPMPYQAVTPPR